MCKNSITPCISHSLTHPARVGVLITATFPPASRSPVHPPGRRERACQNKQNRQTLQGEEGGGREGRGEGRGRERGEKGEGRGERGEGRGERGERGERVAAVVTRPSIH